jgi:cytochrome P450
MGYELPPRTPVLAATRYIAINPANFGAPDRFDPDRWLEPQTGDTQPHNT